VYRDIIGLKNDEVIEQYKMLRNGKFPCSYNRGHLVLLRLWNLEGFGEACGLAREDKRFI
jgi:hypothetical protein